MEFIHPAKRLWHFQENASFSLDFQDLEYIFNEKAIEEEFMTNKQHIKLIAIEVDPKQRVLNLNAELYRLLEN